MILVHQPALRAARQLGWWALGRRRRFRVSGRSMEPTLHDGEFVLVDPMARPGRGDLAVARHPGQPELTVVKRVAGIEPAGYVLASDDPEAGTDSRSWGPVPADEILGRVTLILDRPGAPLGLPVPGSGAGGSGAGGGGRARWLRR